MSGMNYDVMRAHLIADHGYTDDYFDEDYPVGGPITELSTLRWLHAAWANEKGHRDSDLLSVVGATVTAAHSHHYGASAAAAPSPAPEAEEHGTGVVGDGTGVAGMSAFPSPPEERNITLPAGDPNLTQ